MTIHENANVGEFIRAATIERPGVATSVARLAPLHERRFRRDQPIRIFGRTGPCRTHVGRRGKLHAGRRSISTRGRR